MKSLFNSLSNFLSQKLNAGSALKTIPKLKNPFNVLKNKSGQGMVEYILLLVVVVAIVAIFKEKIKGAVTDKMGDLQGKIQGFKGED